MSKLTRSLPMKDTVLLRVRWHVSLDLALGQRCLQLSIAGVCDCCVAQPKLLELFQLLQMHQAGVGNLRATKREAVEFGQVGNLRQTLVGNWDSIEPELPQLRASQQISKT